VKQLLTFIQALQIMATLEFQFIPISTTHSASGKWERVKESRLYATALCNWMYGKNYLCGSKDVNPVTFPKEVE
jgi:hypothetical protein